MKISKSKFDNMSKEELMLKFNQTLIELITSELEVIGSQKYEAWDVNIVSEVLGEILNNGTCKIDYNS
jgi:hypothetical protein